MVDALSYSSAMPQPMSTERSTTSLVARIDEEAEAAWPRKT